MSYDGTGLIGLNNDLCMYDGSRMQFRGPKADLNTRYVAILGGSETFGKFLTDPYPTLLAKHLPASMVNLGMINCGIDAYLSDPAILKIAKQADLRIVQVFGALNQSNHYYKVHPRRNDRFIGACETLIRLFPEVDFAEFHFTKAMLAALHKLSKKRYKMLCDELQKAWVLRMNTLLDEIGEKTILLWFAGSKPLADAISHPLDPMLVNAAMMEKIRSRAKCYVEIVPASPATEEERMELLDVMASPIAVEQALGPSAHLQVAQALQEPAAHLLK